MPVLLKTLRNRHRPRRLRPHLQLEPLEDRSLLSIAWPGLANPVAEVEPNDTLDRAQPLGNLSIAGQAGVVGAVGNSPAGAADVDWYQFTLTAAAHVHLATLDKGTGSPLVSVLGLYNTDASSYLDGYFGDPYDPLGNRLLAQSDGAAAGGDAATDRDLAAGTYYVAVSGSGNSYFNPFVAGSGLDGSTGDYGLQITATALPVDPANGPVVLATDPAAGSALANSPLVLRLDLGSALDPSTIDAFTDDPSQTVWLTFNPNGTFGDGNDQQIPLASANFSPTANELQLTPAGPLAPGYYQVFLAGNSAGNSQGGAVPVLADPNGNPLGMDPLHPDGQDYQFTFQVNGYEGNTAAGAADDTPPTAHDLGDVTQAGLVQVAGTIGDDPYYNTNSFDPVQASAGNDVDLYHFTISGPGRYALTAETFAGRFGSPLLPQNSLFRQGIDANGNVVYTLVGTNSGTFNPTEASGGSVPTPLTYDPLLYAGLTAGDYYLAVSSTGNTPDLSQPSHSAGNGWSTGDYVLNLFVQADNTPPQVVAVTIVGGSTLTAPPTSFNVRFSEQVQLPQLQLPQESAVYVLDTVNGTKYYPSLASYDDTTNQASFLMQDGLPNGTYELHLSGPLGLTDMAGNPLAGNDPTGDYVVRFTVNGPARGTGANPLLWSDQEPNNSPSQPQDLGVLFPNELQAGVTLSRDFNTTPIGPGDGTDYYQFQLLLSPLQSPPTYNFVFSSTGLPPGVQLTLMDASGNAVPGFLTIPPTLGAGTYVLRITGLPATQPADASYQLVITSVWTPGNPTPLTIGPAPILRIRLVTSPPSSPPATPPTDSPPTLSPSGPSSSDPASSVSSSTTSSSDPASPASSLTLSLYGPMLVGATVPPPSLALQGTVSVAPAVLGPTYGTLPATGTRPADGGPVDMGLPSGALLAFSAGPLGGVRDVSPVSPTAFPDRLTLPGPASFFAQASIGPAAAQSTMSGADDEPGSPSGIDRLNPLAKYLRAAEALWNEFRQGGPVGDAVREGRWHEGWRESALLGGGLNRTNLAPDRDEDLAGATDLEATFDPPCDDTWRSFAAGGLWSGRLAVLAAFTTLATFTALGLREQREDRAVAVRLSRAGW